MSQDALGRSPLFADFEADELSHVVAGTQRRSVPAGHVFITLGSSNEVLFVVLSGSVSVERPGVETDVVLATLDSGAVFGEMTFLDGSRAAATVTASEQTEVMELRSEDLHEILSQYPELAVKLWRNLALELRRRLIRTDELVDYYADLTQVLRDNPDSAELLGDI